MKVHQFKEVPIQEKINLQMIGSRSNNHPARGKNLSIIFIFIFIVLILTSCGTMTGIRKTVAIDSNPRGANVYNQYGDKIGSTPFFYQSSKKLGEEFTFELPKNGPNPQTKKVNFRCNINWSDSLVPNAAYLPFYPIGTALGLAFETTDLITGGAFDCDNNLFFNFGDTSKAHNKKANKFLVIPPNYFDEKVSNEIASYWIHKRFEKYRNPGDSFISLDESSRVLLHYGIDHEHKNTFNSIPYSHLIDVASSFDANMIVEFELKREGDLIIIQPVVTDIFSKKTVEKNYSKPYKLHKSLSTKDSLYYYIVKSITLIPNNFSLSFPPTREATVTQGETGSSVQKKKLSKHHSNIPNLIAIWGIGNIDHPLHFRRWDVNAQIRTSLSAHAWEFGENVANIDYHIEYQDILFTAGGSLTFHTPFGAIYTEAGGGPVMYRAQDNFNFKREGFSGFVRLEAAYYAFIGKKFYFKFGIDHFEVPDNLIYTKYFQLKSWQDGFITFGLYLPELKSWVRNAIPF